MTPLPKLYMYRGRFVTQREAKNDNKKQPKNQLCGHYAPETLSTKCKNSHQKANRKNCPKYENLWSRDTNSHKQSL